MNFLAKNVIIISELSFCTAVESPLHCLLAQFWSPPAPLATKCSTIVTIQKSSRSFFRETASASDFDLKHGIFKLYENMSGGNLKTKKEKSEKKSG